MKKKLIFLILPIILFGLAFSFGPKMDVKITTLPVEKPSVGESFSMKINLENLGIDKENLVVSIDSLSNYEDLGPFEIQNTKVEIPTLKSKEKKEISFNLKVKEELTEDEFLFIGRIKYSEEGEEKKYNVVFPLSFSSKAGILSFTKPPYSKVSLETLVSLSGSLKNTGNKEVKDVVVKVGNTDFFTEYMKGKNVRIETIKPGKSVTVTLMLAPTDKVVPKDYTVPIVVEYKDSDGVSYIYEEKATIRVVKNSFTYFVRRILDFFYGFTKNYGIAVILLTLIVKLILFPFTFQQLKSMSKTQELSPMIQELQKKYNDDPKKLQEEQMKLYKKYGINPATGCLMALLPLPIFFILFTSLNGYVKLLNQSFLWIHNLAAPDPTYVIPVLVAGTTLLQQWMMGGAKDQSSKMMMFMFPLLIGYWSLNFPTAVSIYWISFSVFSTLEYSLIKRKYGHLMKLKEKKPKKK